MAAMEWQVFVTASVSKPLSARDIDALVDEFDPHAGVIAANPGGMECEITMAMGADCCEKASCIAMGLVASSRILSDPTIMSLEVYEWERAMAKMDKYPVVPDVVGYADIAKIANVSRQGARSFRKSKTFPRPILETSQGPLFDKNAVLAWNRARVRRLEKRK